MEEDSQVWLRGTATVGSKERRERLSQSPAPFAQRTSVITSTYVMYRGTRTPVTGKSVESDVFDGFEISYSFIIIYYSLFYLP